LVNIEDQLNVPSEEIDEARMKRRKIAEILDSSTKVPPGESTDTVMFQNNTPSSSHQTSVDDTWQELGISTEKIDNCFVLGIDLHSSNALHYVETNNLHGAQRGLHVQLKPELSKLYQLLELPVPLNILNFYFICVSSIFSN
jgi:hypothetical protein